MLALRSTCVVHVIGYHPSRTFFLLSCIMWLVTLSYDVTCCVTAWPYHPTPLPKFKIEKWKIKEWKWKRKKKLKINRVLCFHLWQKGEELVGVSNHPNWIIFARNSSNYNNSPRVIIYINIRLFSLCFLLQKDIFNHRDIMISPRLFNPLSCLTQLAN